MENSSESILTALEEEDSRVAQLTAIAYEESEDAQLPPFERNMAAMVSAVSKELSF